MPPARASASPGHAHDGYFQGLQRALDEAGIGWPCALIDYDRLLRNIARVQSLLPAQAALRLVEKSLPVPALLEEAMQRTGSRRLMLFDVPQLCQVVRRFPDSDVLMGKPMPTLAMAHFYRQDHGRFAAERQLQWLVDTPARLQACAELATRLGVRMRINVEVDIGLRRGGVADVPALRRLLEELRASPALRFAGLMGYDAHIGKLPALVQRRATSLARAQAAYRAFRAAAIEVFPHAAHEACWNGAGSPTLPLHGPDSPLNDLAAGSLLLKPLAFDSDLLADFEPAVFVVTPVLKALRGTRLPGPRWLSRLLYGGRRGRARSYFVYGGGWPAEPVSPPGLRGNRPFGLSFNQAIFNGPASPALQCDERIFLRPWQSEGTLLQHGPVQVVARGRVVVAWPPFGVL